MRDGRGACWMAMPYTRSVATDVFIGVCNNYSPAVRSVRPPAGAVGTSAGGSGAMWIRCLLRIPRCGVLNSGFAFFRVFRSIRAQC